MLCRRKEMKKLFVLTMAVALLTAGSAMAGLVAPNATFTTGNPLTTNNDDSCDIAVTPAATLLLPVFEVDIANTNRTTAVDTIFTIVNTSALPQIAHITLWTDWSFPVLDFNVFLTGYDVQGISLYDVIARGVLPGGGNQVAEGSLSADNDANPFHAAASAVTCSNLPTQIPATTLADLRSALTAGTAAGLCGSVRIGGTHTNAIGYVTIDVGNNCSQSLPTSSSYYTGEILFDNVLTGDYQRINPTATTGNYAGGESLVHIRAIPEGGPAGATIPTNLPYTFYDRYTPGGARSIDRRQPLPATFAARYIEGGAGSFNTNFAIWREGINNAATCSQAAANSALGITEIVRFDERENPSSFGIAIPISPAPPTVISLPEASRVATSSGTFPPNNSTDLGGWMYLNLDNGVSTAGYSDPTRASQNWVVVQMSAEGRYGVDFDATYLGNGCSAPLPAGVEIGPADNDTPAL
jgi:hypothetical protein